MQCFHRNHYRFSHEMGHFSDLFRLEGTHKRTTKITFKFVEPPEFRQIMKRIWGIWGLWGPIYNTVGLYIVNLHVYSKIESLTFAFCQIDEPL